MPDIVVIPVIPYVDFYIPINGRVIDTKVFTDGF